MVLCDLEVDVIRLLNAMPKKNTSKIPLKEVLHANVMSCFGLNIAEKVS